MTPPADAKRFCTLTHPDNRSRTPHRAGECPPPPEAKETCAKCGHERLGKYCVVRSVCGCKCWRVAPPSSAAPAAKETCFCGAPKQTVGGHKWDQARGCGSLPLNDYYYEDDGFTLKHPAPAAKARRCLVTGNPCGTDTWPADKPCACGECVAYLANTAAKETHGDPYCLPPFNEHSCPKCMASALAKAEAELQYQYGYADEVGMGLSHYSGCTEGSPCVRCEKERLEQRLAKAVGLLEDEHLASLLVPVSEHRRRNTECEACDFLAREKERA